MMRHGGGRVERLLTGGGRFLANQDLPEAAVAFFLRSPVAHGTIRRLDVKAARQAPGVLDVVTADEVAAAGLGPLPCLVEPAPDGPPLIEPPRPLLAGERVRHVGEPVAMVVAETLEQAKDAAELIDLAIDPLPAAIELEGARSAPAIWEGCQDNIAFDWRAGDAAAVDAAIATAAHVTRLRLINNRIVMAPIETRSAAGSFDPESGRYTLRTPCQGVHRIRTIMARVLGTSPDAIHVITDDVGGSFGLKGMGYPEQPLVLLAARRTGRTVRFEAERTESFVTDNAARDHLTEVTLALDEDARITAVRFDTIANMGAYLSTMAPRIATLVYGRVPSGVYAIDALTMRVRCVFTNTTPVDAYRGAGVPEAIYALERAIDVAAKELGTDPVQLRRKNFLSPERMPVPTPGGYAIDSGDFPAALDRALEVSDWSGFDVRKQSAAARGLRRGRGLACYIHGTGGAATETVVLRARPDGTVLMLSGAQDSGQGHAETFARLVGEALDLPPEKVVLQQGDSDLLHRGAGTGGSGSLVIASQVIGTAAERLLEVAREIAARELEVASADLAYSGGTFRVVGTDRRITLAEAAAAMPDDACCGEADFEGDYKTYPNGVYVAEVEVDPETGRVILDRFTAVDDLGRIVDPVSADAQIIGGLAQGIGQALMEHDRHDPESGQPLSGSLMDYTLPRADDLPSFRLAKSPTPAPGNPTGIKGAGESGAIGSPPAVIAAVADAIGVPHIDMPATSEAVWRALGSIRQRRRPHRRR